MLTKSTTFYTTADFTPKWYVIDATDMVLGRLAVKVADLIRGKTNPRFSPQAECGDFVIVVNADKVKLTGNKLADKEYHRITGYFGHVKTATARELIEKKPETMIEIAVKGMLPKNRIARHIIKNLKVYRGASHPHQAQNPIPLSSERG